MKKFTSLVVTSLVTLLHWQHNVSQSTCRHRATMPSQSESRSRSLWARKSIAPGTYRFSLISSPIPALRGQH